MIARCKYFGEQNLTDPLADLILEPLQALLSSLTPRMRERMIVIPIPLHPKRWRERGFSQSELLARHIAKASGVRLAPTRSLVRRRYTRAQVSLSSRAERLENMKDAFLAKTPELFADNIILLVDDVATTGATLNEAARALKLAGAKSVWGVVVAHG